MLKPFQKDVYEIMDEMSDTELSPKIIALHVFNRRNDFFDNDNSFEKLYSQVRMFLWSKANDKTSRIRFGKKRGYYAINKEDVSQTWICFDTDDASQKKEESPSETSEDEFPLFDLM